MKRAEALREAMEETETYRFNESLLSCTLCPSTSRRELCTKWCRIDSRCCRRMRGSASLLPVSCRRLGQKSLVPASVMLELCPTLFSAEVVSAIRRRCETSDLLTSGCLGRDLPCNSSSDSAKTSDHLKT